MVPEEVKRGSFGQIVEGLWVMGGCLYFILEVMDSY